MNYGIVPFSLPYYALCHFSIMYSVFLPALLCLISFNTHPAAASQQVT